MHLVYSHSCSPISISLSISFWIREKRIQWTQNERIKRESSQVKLSSRCTQVFSIFFVEIQLTNATFEKQFRYLPPRELSSRRQARRGRASYLVIPTRRPSSFSSPGSPKPRAAAGNGGLGKIHQPRESLVLVIDVRETVLSLCVAIYLRSATRASFLLSFGICCRII